MQPHKSAHLLKSISLRTNTKLINVSELCAKEQIVCVCVCAFPCCVSLCIRVQVCMCLFPHVSLHMWTTHTHTHVQRSSRDEGSSYHCCKKLSLDCFPTLQLQTREQRAVFKDKCAPCRQTEAEKVPNPQPLITSQWRTAAPLKDAALTEWTCPSVCYLPIQWAAALSWRFKRKGRSKVLFLMNSLLFSLCLYYLSFFIFCSPVFLSFSSLKFKYLSRAREDQSCSIIPFNTLEMLCDMTDSLKPDCPRLEHPASSVCRAAFKELSIMI